MKTNDLRTGRFGITTTCCTACGTTAVVYLNGEKPLCNGHRVELIDSEKALATIEHRKPRILKLLPVWSLNAASAVLSGDLTPKINRQGEEGKLCCLPECGHYAGNWGIAKNGVAHLFCGGCGEAMAFVATKCKRTDRVPVRAEDARKEAARQREAIDAVNKGKAGFAASLLGTVSPTTLALALQAAKPVVAAIEAKPAEASPRQPRRDGKKAREAAEAAAKAAAAAPTAPIAVEAATSPAAN